jgi:DNA mismatch endonuclease (patch repair protein)
MRAAWSEILNDRGDILTPAQRSERMRRIRSKDTRPEIIVREAAGSLRLKFEVDCPELPGRPDIVFRQRKCAVFVHGCFWHCHVGCKNNRPPKSRRAYWRPKLKRNVQRDAATRVRLRQMGWRVLTIWECETADLESLQNRLKHLVSGRTVTSMTRTKSGGPHRVH